MSERVPEGWTKIKLGEVGTFSTSSVDKKSVEGEREVSLLNYMDVYKHSILSEKYPFQKVTAPSKQVSSSSVQRGDVFFTPSSETPDDIGHSAAFIGEPTDIVHSYHTIRFRPSSKEYLEDAFKGYAFKGTETYEYFRKRATGSTRFTVSLPIFNELELIVPPLPEQKKIASILTSVDEVIENTQKQIDKLQDLKKATMNELLTKGIGHTEFKDSELGRIPKSWEVCILGNYVKLQGGNAFPSSEFCDSGVPVVRISNIVNGVVDLSGCIFFTASERFQNFVAYEGDILLAMSGATTGKIGIYRYGAPSYLNQRVGRFKVTNKSKVDTDFLHHLVQSRIFSDSTLRDAIGGAQPNISSSQVESVIYAFPALSEQKLIATTLASVDQQINAQNRKLQQTQSLKKSLMQDLLTGKVRVQVN